MIEEILRTTKGIELRILMILLSKSKDGFFNGIERMADFGIDPEKVQNCLESLKKRRYLEYVVDSDRINVVLAPPLKELSEHLQSFRPQLELKIDDTRVQSNGSGVSRAKEMAAVIRHYALAKGVPEDKLKVWNRGKNGFKAQIKSALKLLEYCGTAERANEVIDKAKKYYEKRDLDWSLQGAILNNIQVFIGDRKKENPEWI